MQNYFRVSNHQIPIELKDLYLEISKEFEARVYDSISMEKNYEEVKEDSFKLSYS